MKEGDKARSKSTQFTGIIAGLQTRIKNGVTVIERVLIKAAAGSRMWVDVDDVEVIAAAAGESA